MVTIVDCPSCRSHVIATEGVDGKCKGCGREYYWGSSMEYDYESFEPAYGVVWLDKVHMEGWEPIDYIDEIPPYAVIPVNMRNKPTKKRKR